MMINEIFEFVKNTELDFIARIEGLGEIYRSYSRHIPEDMIISAKDYVDAFIKTHKKKKFSHRGLNFDSYISEKVLHIPKIKEKILIKNDVDWHSHSNDYGCLMDYLNSLEEQVHFVENTEPIPFNRFKEEGLTRFLFGNEAEEIGLKISEYFLRFKKNELDLSFIENDKELVQAMKQGVVSKCTNSWGDYLPLNKMKNFSANLNLDFSSSGPCLSGIGADYGSFHLVNRNPRQGKNGGNIFQGELSPWLNDFVKRKNSETNLKKLKEILLKNVGESILFVENSKRSFRYHEMYIGKISSDLDLEFGRVNKNFKVNFLQFPLEYFSKFVIDKFESPRKGYVKDSEPKIYVGVERGSVPTFDSKYKLKLVGSLLEEHNQIEVYIGTPSVEEKIVNTLNYNGVENFQSYFNFLEKSNLKPSQKLTESLQSLRFAKRILNYTNKTYGDRLATGLINLLVDNEKSLENVEILPGLQANLSKYSR
jgi:hypothetical protein